VHKLLPKKQTGAQALFFRFMFAKKSFAILAVLAISAIVEISFLLLTARNPCTLFQH
jgi:hypothetical protein